LNTKIGIHSLNIFKIGRVQFLVLFMIITVVFGLINIIRLKYSADISASNYLLIKGLVSFFYLLSITSILFFRLNSIQQSFLWILPNWIAFFFSDENILLIERIFYIKLNSFSVFSLVFDVLAIVILIAMVAIPPKKSKGISTDSHL